jgi:membrane AbrB-like protein
MVVAAELGADLRVFAIVQTIRVMLIAIGLPGGLALLGLVKTSSRAVGGAFDPSRIGELALLIAASAIAGLLAFRFRVPGGLLFGAMLCSASLHGSGLVHVPMPWWAATAAAIVLGAVAGSRFANTSVRLLLQFLAAAFGTFAISVTIAAVFAVLLINMRALHIADVVLAFAPGSVDVMMLLALALNIDPVFVGTHHLARIFFVMLAMPVVARRASHRRDGWMQGREITERGEPPRHPPFQD